MNKEEIRKEIEKFGYELVRENVAIQTYKKGIFYSEFMFSLGCVSMCFHFELGEVYKTVIDHIAIKELSDIAFVLDRTEKVIG